MNNIKKIIIAVIVLTLIPFPKSIDHKNLTAKNETYAVKETKVWNTRQPLFKPNTTRPNGIGEIETMDELKIYIEKYRFANKTFVVNYELVNTKDSSKIINVEETYNDFDDVVKNLKTTTSVQQFEKIETEKTTYHITNLIGLLFGMTVEKSVEKELTTNGVWVEKDGPINAQLKLFWVKQRTMSPAPGKKNTMYSTTTIIDREHVQSK